MPKLRFVKLIGPKAVIFTAVLLVFMVGTAWAYINRPNPLMDYAPQETGIYDTYYDYLTETDCRFCHGSSTSDRHHWTDPGIAGDCIHCHPPFAPGTPASEVPKETNCRSAGGTGYTCHAGFSNGWHHTNYLAESAQCTACHGWIGDYVSEVATTPTSDVTPTPYSCENCHWSEDPSTDHPSTDIHYDLWWQTFANFQCSIPGQFDPSNDYGRMEVDDDGYHYSRPIKDNLTTHHMEDLGGVSGQCGLCHAYTETNPVWDPDDPQVIRYCEKCHDINSLHMIPGHVDNGEYPFGGVDWPTGGNNAKAWEAAEFSGSGGIAQVYRQFGVNERCNGCHGDYRYGVEPPYAECDPVVDSILPNAGQVGMVVRLEGSCFGMEVMDGNKVEIMPTDFSKPWTEVPIADWGDTRVVWVLPAWLAPPGNYYVRLTAMKWDDLNGNGVVDEGELTEKRASYKPVFTVANSPNIIDFITNMDPAGWNDDLTADGPYYSKAYIKASGGLGQTRRQMDTGPIPPPADSSLPQTKLITSVVLTSVEQPPPGGGLAGSYVVPVGENIGGITRNSIVSWSPTLIKFFLRDLWRDNNGNGIYESADDNLMDPSNVHVGSYNVYVRTIYYLDYDTSNWPTQTDPDAMPGSPENEILLECRSDPAHLNLTATPYIFKIKPKYMRASWRYCKLIGVNFGDQIYDSTVNIYKNDGVTLRFTLTAADMGTRILRWHQTRVKLHLGRKICPVGSRRKVSVTVAGVESNKRKLVTVP